VGFGTIIGKGDRLGFKLDVGKLYGSDLGVCDCCVSCVCCDCCGLSSLVDSCSIGLLPIRFGSIEG